MLEEELKKEEAPVFSKPALEEEGKEELKKDAAKVSVVVSPCNSSSSEYSGYSYKYSGDLVSVEVEVDAAVDVGDTKVVVVVVVEGSVNSVG